MMTIAGPKPNSSVVQGLSSAPIGTALISTLWSIRKDSRLSSTKAGSVVSKVCEVRGSMVRCPDVRAPRVPVAAADSGCGQVTGLWKRPSMTSPLL